MKRKAVLKKTAALILSSTMLVSLPVTANAATVTDNGEYEILFNNYYSGGTIDGIHDSKHVSFNFDSDDEVVNLSDLVGTNVKYKYYAFEGWKTSDGDVLTTITKDDFDGGHYLNLKAEFEYQRPSGSDSWYIEMDFGTVGHSDDYPTGQYTTSYCVEIPKSQFSDFTLPIPDVSDNVEFLGWVDDSWSYNERHYDVTNTYSVITEDDLEKGWSDVMSVAASYKVKAGPNDTSNTFTLDANGGTIDGKDSETYINPGYDAYDTQDLSHFIPVNDDESLVFGGWNTEPDGSGYIINHTGFKDNEFASADVPGVADIFQCFGDDDGNVTLYAMWKNEIKVSPKTNSQTDKMIAEKLTALFAENGDEDWEYLGEEETAEIIKAESDSGKKISAGLVMEKDTSDKAKKNIEECQDRYSYHGYNFADYGYRIYVSVMADGKEICRIKNFGTVLYDIEFELPNSIFTGSENDSKTAVLYLIGHDDDGDLAVKTFDGKAVDNTFYADVSRFSMRMGDDIADSDYETAVIAGKSEMNVKPYDPDNENDADVAESVVNRLTNYRDSKSDYSWKGEKILSEYDKILEAYESGKEITARFVMNRITPTDEQKANILDHLAADEDSDYKDFTPLVYYSIQQYVYADGEFLTTFSDSYSSVEIKTVVNEIKTLPAEPDPRHSREFAFVSTIKDSDGNWRVEDFSAETDESGNVNGYYYADECSIYAFGYTMGGKYRVNFDAYGTSINGKVYNNTLTFKFNFLSDDEQLDVKDFFGVDNVKDVLHPYAKFKEWITNDWDFQTGEYLKTPVSTVTKNLFSSYDNSLYLSPVFDDTVPKNSGTYYISICTRGGTIKDLPTFNGKVSWSDAFNGYGLNTYIGTVKSSDLTSLTLPDPTPVEGQKFLGWNSAFDPESGTVKSHGSTITAADFAESDVFELMAEYICPIKEGEEHRYMAQLFGNGGTIDGKESAWYRAASGTSAGSYSMNLIVPVRAGYKFTGWNTKADGSGYEVDDAGAASMSIFSPYHEPRLSDDNYNVALYAQWELTGPAVEKVTLSKTAATLEIGGTLTLTATVSPSDAVNKTLTWKSSDEKVATVTSEGKVKAVGNGKAVITAQSSNGVKAECTITANTLLNNSVLSADSVVTGNSVTITAKAEGGTSPYKYAYYYKKSTDTDWTKLSKENGSAYVTASTFKFKPAAVGSYDIKVNVKDSNNKTVAKTLKVVCVNALENDSSISTASTAVNTAVTLTGKAVGGISPYTYAYYYKKSTDSAWTKLVTENGSAYVTASTQQFKPTEAGTYDIKINVKDNAGTTVQKQFTLTVKGEALKNSSTLSATSVTANTTVTLTGKATGGTSPYKYAYYYKKSTDSAWTKAYVTSSGSAYTKYDSVTFKPTTAGTYNVRINVKDKYGEGDVVSKEFTLTVKEAVAALANNSTISATSVNANTEVTLTGKATGGTSPYKYAYYYKKSTDSAWTKAYVTSSGSAYTKYDSVTFKPTTAGTYNVRINVKDKYGEGDVVSKEFTLTVKEAAAALANNSTISATSVDVNTEVTLNGKATGGTSPYKYAYYYKKSTDSAWTKAYVTSSGSAYTKYDSVTFKPTTAGTYNVRINVKDKYGEGDVVSKEFTLTVKEAAAALANNSTISATSVDVNTEVTLTGKATGGTSPYKYAYYYKKSTDSAWTKAYVTSSGSAYTKYDSVTFKPTTAGTYNVRINVKDKYGEGDVVSKDFTVTVK